MTNPCTENNIHQGFFTVLWLFSSPYLQLVLYQVLRFNSTWFCYGFTHVLLITYFVPTVVAVVTFVVCILFRFNKQLKNPFFLKIDKLLILGSMTVVTKIFEFWALILNPLQDFHQQTIYSKSSALIWDLIRFLMLQQIVQIIAIPLLGKFLLRNKFQKKRYFKNMGFVLACYFVYEFVTFDTNHIKQNPYNEIVTDKNQDFQIMIPANYNFKSDVLINNFPFFSDQGFLPFFFTIISAILKSTKYVLELKFLLKQGYLRKLKLDNREQMRIKYESEINPQFLENGGVMVKRKLLKNSQIVKRYRSIHEYYQKERLIKKSQLIDPKKDIKEKENALLVPYQKVSYLPAYFFKVFVMNLQHKKKEKPIQKKHGQITQQSNLEGNHIAAKMKNFLSRINKGKGEYEAKSQLKIKVSKMITKPNKKTIFAEKLKKYKNKKKELLKIHQKFRDDRFLARQMNEVALMLDQNDQSAFHLHLFSDYDEVHLSRLDLIYANQHYMYNEEFIGCDLKQTFLIQYVTEHLIVAPIGLFLDLWINTEGTIVNKLYSSQTKIQTTTNQQWLLAFPFVFGILIALRPWASYHYSMTFQPQKQRNLYFFMMMAIYFVYALLFQYSMFVDLKCFICFMIMCYFRTFIQEQVENDWIMKQDSQIIQILGANMFQQDKTNFKKFTDQLDVICTSLGKDTFYSVVEDCLMSNHPKSLNHLAPPIMPLRKKFDFNYHKITSQWAGGYPRPMVEVSESLWDFSDTLQLIKGPKAQDIIKMNAEEISPDLDLADLVYQKQLAWEAQYGKINYQMKKYGNAAYNQQMRESQRQKSMFVAQANSIKDQNLDIFLGAPQAPKASHLGPNEQLFVNPQSVQRQRKQQITNKLAQQQPNEQDQQSQQQMLMYQQWMMNYQQQYAQFQLQQLANSQQSFFQQTGQTFNQTGNTFSMNMTTGNLGGGNQSKPQSNNLNAIKEDPDEENGIEAIDDIEVPVKRRKGGKEESPQKVNQQKKLTQTQQFNKAQQQKLNQTNQSSKGFNKTGTSIANRQLPKSKEVPKVVPEVIQETPKVDLSEIMEEHDELMDSKRKLLLNEDENNPQTIDEKLNTTANEESGKNDKKQNQYNSFDSTDKKHQPKFEDKKEPIMTATMKKVMDKSKQNQLNINKETEPKHGQEQMNSTVLKRFEEESQPPEINDNNLKGKKPSFLHQHVFKK